LVHFCELWPTNENLRGLSTLHVSKVYQWCTACATPTIRTYNRRQYVSCRAMSHNFGTSLFDVYWADSVRVRCFVVTEWSIVLWSTCVNFGLLSQKLATRQTETSAEVPIRLRRMPQSLFGLSRVEIVCRAGHCLATSRSRTSRPARPIRFGFRLKRSRVVGSSKLVHALPRRPYSTPNHAKCGGVFSRLRLRPFDFDIGRPEKFKVDLRRNYEWQISDTWQTCATALVLYRLTSSLHAYPPPFSSYLGSKKNFPTRFSRQPRSACGRFDTRSMGLDVGYVPLVSRCCDAPFGGGGEKVTPNLWAEKTIRAIHTSQTR
jgi:hypothetical protein